ncbi:hypothetical protein evm_009741 [Chilo suppressalis]|nr:hypothetical protein evm_009741 [Chilo suppressalis]
MKFLVVLSAVVAVSFGLSSDQDAVPAFRADVSDDGSYRYNLEITNGIAVEEEGSPRNLGGNPPVVPIVVKGAYSFTAPNGEPVAISYVADENGFQPQGAVIPTAPPVPEQIARALEYLAKAGKL